jgi:hypothetical protein
MEKYARKLKIGRGLAANWIMIVLAVILPSAALAQTHDSIPEPTQNTEVTYRLFRTQNIYTLLKLDTRNGHVWQVQWNTESEKRFVAPIYPYGRNPCSSTALGTVCQPTTLVKGGEARVGRFTLYPTPNIYTFILLDQDTGSIWQVQWGETALSIPIE